MLWGAGRRRVWGGWGENASEFEGSCQRWGGVGVIGRVCLGRRERERDGKEMKGRRDGTFFEEEADLVAAGEEVVVADVRFAAAGAGGEARHRVGGEGDGGEEVVRLGEQGGDGAGGEGVGDDEVAVSLVGG